MGILTQPSTGEQPTPPTIEPTPTGSQTSSLTFALVPPATGRGSSNVIVFDNGKQVATLYYQEPVSEIPAGINYVNVYAEANQKVLLNVTPQIGLGDITNHVGPLDIIDLRNDTSTVLGYLASPAVAWTPDLQYIAFCMLGQNDDSYILNIADTDYNTDEEIEIPVPAASFQGQSPYVTDLGFSPDGNKVAVVQSYSGKEGPDFVAASLYVVTVNGGQISEYAEDTSSSIQIDGWKDNNDVEWSRW
jgi:hypothetical protein